MQLNITIENMLLQIRTVLNSLTDDQYITPVVSMSGSTIGEHTRHIIEFYLELSNGYENGIVNYDNRKRNHHIQTRRSFAIEKINEISGSLMNRNKNLLLKSNFGSTTGDGYTTPTNYTRELIYNLEHTVHHMALIRVAVNILTRICLPVEFGVAASTLQFREACAQ